MECNERLFTYIFFTLDRNKHNKMELENLVTQSLDEYVKELQRNLQILKQFFGRKICDKILLACPWSKHEGPETQEVSS